MQRKSDEDDGVEYETSDSRIGVFSDMFRPPRGGLFGTLIDRYLGGYKFGK